jgi:hypothetical protein
LEEWLVRNLFIKLSVIISGLAVMALPLQAAAMDRIGVTFTNGDLYIKEGPINSAWHQETSGVNIGNYSLSGDRMSLLDVGNSQKPVSIKEPSWNSQWNWTYFSDGGQPNASKQLVSKLSNGQYRLLVLRADGSVVMKDGPWNTGWWSGTIEASGVSDIVIGGDRIGEIMNNGDFKVKQLTPGQFSHPNNTSWNLEATGASAGKAAMTNNRLAYINSSNQIQVKDGGLTDSWSQAGPGYIFDTASKVLLSANRICVLRTDNIVLCKDGSPGASAVKVYNNATDMSLSQSNSNRIVVMTSDHSAYALEGSIYGANSGWQFVGIGNIASIGTN